ncbi:MAG: hypothetical protein ACO2XQ_09325, partial [Flavobacteriales bacterium]
MKHWMTLLALVVAVTAGAQSEDPIVFPFNPDANYDGILGVEDLLAMLSGFGEEVALPNYTEWATGAMFNLLDFEAELNEEYDSLAAAWTEYESAYNELDSIIAFANQGLPITQGNTCRVQGQAVYGWEGGFPYYYSVPSSCSFVWVN